jgi:hypothetical protein
MSKTARTDPDAVSDPYTTLDRGKPFVNMAEDLVRELRAAR